jgi:Zn finger protein HypA/HybF involved in hydrogenase expression
VDATSQAETGSLQEFPCQSCGAKLSFKPGADALVCPYCGTKQDIEASEAPIVEYSLDEGLSQAKRSRAKDLAQHGVEMECNGCGARSIVTKQSDHCAFCGSPMVVEVDSDDELILPESVLPFKVDDKQAKAEFQTWVGSRWFAPNDLKKRARTQGMDGAYLPHWTFDSQTTTRYSGQRGDHYYETETYTDSEGNRQEREVRKTRWRSASGTVHVPFDDVLVCASKTLPDKLVQDLEPWDLGALKAFQPAYLAGFATERYTVELRQGFSLAEQRMEPEIRTEIRRDIGGDEQRISSMNVRHDNTTFKHILLPLWISSFRYGDKVYRVVINARTGEVAGERPWSAIKIALAVLLGVALIGTIVYLYANQGG